MIQTVPMAWVAGALNSHHAKDNNNSQFPPAFVQQRFWRVTDGGYHPGAVASSIILFSAKKAPKIFIADRRFWTLAVVYSVKITRGKLGRVAIIEG